MAFLRVADTATPFAKPLNLTKLTNVNGQRQKIKINGGAKEVLGVKANSMLR